MTAFTAQSEQTILTPDDPGWDEARRAWNLAVDQHPAAVAVPRSAQDAVAAVNFARDHGLRVAAQGTGHNAAPLGDLGDTVLINTYALGGEMSRARPGHGALAAVAAPCLMLAGGIAPTGQAAAAVGAYAELVKSATSGWTARQTYLNLTESQADPARFWSPQAYDRLRRIKAAVGPANLIRANHPVPLPDRSTGRGPAQET
jgi:FAD binding domain/Berberine and berberine like